jgi:hypothetical protein
VPAEDRDIVTETLKRDFQCLPVFLSSDVAADVRDFTDKIIRPIFHFQVCTPLRARALGAVSRPRRPRSRPLTTADAASASSPYR